MAVAASSRSSSSYHVTTRGGDEQYNKQVARLSLPPLFILPPTGHFYKVDLQKVGDAFDKSFLLAYKGPPPDCPGLIPHWPPRDLTPLDPTILVLDNFIYAIGGVYDPPPVIGTCDVFYLDTQHPEAGWKEAAQMLTPHGLLPPAAALAGKIYVFGGVIGSIAEVYDPQINRWTLFLVSESTRMKFVSHHPLPDPLNGRILVHLKDDCSIYAYYPDRDDDEKWRCVVPQFGMSWDRGATVVDDVLYLLPEDSDQMLAFDLVECRWLTTSWRSKFDWSIDGLHWETLMYLGKDTFFAGVYCPIRSVPGKSVVQLLTFTAEKRADDGEILLDAGVCNSVLVEGCGGPAEFFLMQ